MSLSGSSMSSTKGESSQNSDAFKSKKKIVRMSKDEIAKLTVEDWMNEVGCIYGSTEVRENVNDLKSHLDPAIDSLHKLLPYCGEKLTEEIKKLLCYYENMTRICVQMSDRMELPEVNLSQTTISLNHSEVSQSRSTSGESKQSSGKSSSASSKRGSKRGMAK